jgi:glycosyltransferase involved in cell wall biosynthesis
MVSIGKRQQASNLKPGEKDVRRRLTSKLRRLKNYRLGLIAAELASFILASARNIKSFDRKLVSLKAKRATRGHVLLCYENKGFFLNPGERMPNDHTNRWESVQIAQSFLELGYEVDVISENNNWFVPAKHYSFFIGNRINFDRIAAFINRDCVKILHIDTAHWLFNNTGEHQRLLALQQRRGFTLPTRRSLPPNLAIEHADYATILGNDFTASTYAYAGKPLYRIPISSAALYPWPADKNFESCRTHYLWLGSYGLVHKGLDLVLEAFAQMPDYHLTICGPIHQERDFTAAYEEELYGTPNIHARGWIDLESAEFLEISRRSIALIYPSCSEGQSGGVVTCLHAGLIPVISYQSGVDVNGFGLVLKDCSIPNIKDSVRTISSLSSGELQARSRQAWEYSRTHHTRETFAKEYRNAISAILARLGNKELPARLTAASIELAQASSQPLQNSPR